MPESLSEKKSTLPAIIISLFVLLAIFLAAVFFILFFEQRSGSSSKDASADASSFVFSQSELGQIYSNISRSSGPSDAPIRIVEFSDFECPYCGASFPILKEVLAEYEGKIQFIYRDFIASDVHENAQLAAVASRCAAEQDAFLKYHDKLFLNQDSLDTDSLVIYAIQLGLDVREFTECLVSDKYDEAVQQDTIQAIQLGFVGTPTWAINEYKLQGVVPKDVWVQIIENILAEN